MNEEQDDHSEDVGAHGTLFLVGSYLVLIAAMWGLTYWLLLSRS